MRQITPMKILSPIILIGLTYFTFKTIAIFENP